MVQIQVDYQTKEQYIVFNILKYKSDNLTIFYSYIYSRLSDIAEIIIAEIIIQNSIGLVRNVGFGS